MCQECNGSRQISRPIEHKIHRISVRGEENDHWVTSVLGGVDACPTCAQIAEAEYMTYDWRAAAKEDEAKDAFFDGKNAYREGQTPNPHPPATPEHRHWQDGFNGERKLCEQKEGE